MLDGVTGEPGAPVRILAPAEKDRLADIRETSARRWKAFVDEGPSDALGAIAWLVGAVGSTPADFRQMRVRLERARAEGFTWRQIADALGEGDSPEAARRVMDRQRFWASQD